MKLDILNINEFIKQENLQEITNPVYFNIGNIPTEEGLFSYTIFGKPGSDDRKQKFGYINLKKKFIHPAVFYLFQKLSQPIIDIILCNKFYKIDSSGNLIEDKENGKTGINFLYKNYDKIVIKETNTRSRAKKLSLLANLKKNEIFIDKYLVIPCFYRDFNLGNNENDTPKVDEVNKIYAKIIMLCQNISDSDDLYDFMGLNTESNIQQALNDLYDYFTDFISGKNGIIHKGLLGKTVDYSTRSVISTQRFKSDSYKNMQVPFGYTGVPVSQLINLFYPFYVKWIQDFMEQHEYDTKIINKKSKLENEKLNIKELFNEELIKKLLERFVKNEQDRFQVLCVEDNFGNIYEIEVLKEQLKRPFTLMDLLYIASDDICKDKHIYLTRFPIETYQSIYPSKISILSTVKTTTMTIEDKYLPNYPLIIPDYPVSSSELINTVVLNGKYLDSLGADFDGRQTSIS